MLQALNYCKQCDVLLQSSPQLYILFTSLGHCTQCSFQESLTDKKRGENAAVLQLNMCACDLQHKEKKNIPFGGRQARLLQRYQRNGSSAKEEEKKNPFS